MTKNEILSQLNQLLKVASSDLTDMQRRVRLFSSDHTEDCNDCWQDGYEEALEPFENLVDDLTRLIKNVEMSEVMERPITIVTERQKQLL